MKTLTLLLVTAAMLHADPPRFQITKSTIDGGGDHSTVKRFALTGTIGQPEAAPQFASASNRFAIEPGFWDRFTVVQQSGMPQLVIRRGTPGFAVLAWPIAANGFILQESPDLSAGSWTDVGAPVVNTVTEHTVTIAIIAPKKFFRLRS